MFRVFIALLLFLAIATTARADPLAEAVRVMTSTPIVAGHIDLALHLQTQGHVTLANRAGERFTASLDKVDELARAIATLAPETKSGSAPTLHLTRHALLTPWSRQPVPAKYRVVVGDRSYPATVMGATANNKLTPTVEIAPGWTLGTWDAQLLVDAIQSLARPLKRSELRVIALVPGAPRVLSATPRFAPDGKAALVDPVDPTAVGEVIAAARHQTLIFSGATGSWADMLTAAQFNDVTLMRLETGSSAQPGGRNFLWLPVRTPVMTTHAEQMTLLDLLVLSAGKRVGRISPQRLEGRQLFEVSLGPPAESNAHFGSWIDRISEVVDDLTGNVQARSMTISLPTVARQLELDRRIVKSVPSWLQFGYITLLLLGLVGLPTAWNWFARVWPPEAASDYANAMGFHAARAVRAALFAVVFMPSAAIVAAPVQLTSLLKRRQA